MNLSRRHFVAGSLAAVGTGSLAGPPTASQTLSLRPVPVIFDTDLGSDIDDTWALLYMLRCRELKPVLIAADAGDRNYRTRLAAKFLTAAGRTDIPLAGTEGDGAERGNQRDWLGDYKLDDYPGTIHDDAPAAIVDAIHASPDPVTLVCIGAVPNIAEALRQDPTIVDNARFVGMHGSIRVGYGNSPKPVAEANVRTDPASLRQVFAGDWQCSVTPLDTCGDIVLDGDRYARLRESEDPALVALLENYEAWLRRVPWLDVKPDPAKISSVLFDLVAVEMAFDESRLNFETLPLMVTDDGRTVIDTAGPPLRCATSWRDREGFLDRVTERLLGND